MKSSLSLKILYRTNIAFTTSKQPPLRSRLLLTKSGCLFAFIPSPAQPLVVETVVFMWVCATFCPVLPHFAKLCIIVKLECRGK